MNTRIYLWAFVALFSLLLGARTAAAQTFTAPAIDNHSISAATSTISGQSDTWSLSYRVTPGQMTPPGTYMAYSTTYLVVCRYQYRHSSGALESEVFTRVAYTAPSSGGTTVKTFTGNGSLYTYDLGEAPDHNFNQWRRQYAVTIYATDVANTWLQDNEVAQTQWEPWQPTY